MQCFNKPLTKLAYGNTSSSPLSIQIKEATLAYCREKQVNVSYYEQIKGLETVKKILTYPNDSVSSEVQEPIATLLSFPPTEPPGSK